MVYDVSEDYDIVDKSVGLIISSIERNLNVRPTVVCFSYRTFTIPANAYVRLSHKYYLKVYEGDNLIGLLDIRKIEVIYFG